jgi:hypothetical protein
MSIVLLVIIAFVSVIIGLVVTFDKDFNTGVGICFLGLFFFVFSWITVSARMDNIETHTETYKIMQSEDGYQYITEYGRPFNITRHFGKTIPDGYVIQKIFYKNVYFGISYPGEISSDRLIVEIEK